MEHLGISEYLSKAMHAQGYKLKTVLAKEYESVIRVLTNGKDSCTSNSIHEAIKSTDKI